MSRAKRRTLCPNGLHARPLSAINCGGLAVVFEGVQVQHSKLSSAAEFRRTQHDCVHGNATTLSRIPALDEARRRLLASPPRSATPRRECARRRGSRARSGPALELSTRNIHARRSLRAAAARRASPSYCLAAARHLHSLGSLDRGTRPHVDLFAAWLASGMPLLLSAAGGGAARQPARRRRRWEPRAQETGATERGLCGRC
jgi:hypothetical protein